LATKALPFISDLQTRNPDVLTKLFASSWIGVASLFSNVVLIAFFVLGFILTIGWAAYILIGRTIVRGIIFCLAFVLSPVFGEYAARGLDRLFWGTVRSKSMGLDTVDTRVTKVTTSWRGSPWRPLGERVHERLVAVGEEHIVAMWLELQSRLGMTDPTIPILLNGAKHGETDTLEFDVLTDSLNWRVLTHSSYFEVPFIRKLICYALLQRAGLGVSEALKSDPEFLEVSAAYEEIRPLSEREIEEAGILLQQESPKMQGKAVSLLFRVLKRENEHRRLHGYRDWDSELLRRALDLLERAGVRAGRFPLGADDWRALSEAQL
jgi:hypothetical protein